MRLHRYNMRASPAGLKSKPVVFEESKVCDTSGNCVKISRCNVCNSLLDLHNKEEIEVNNLFSNKASLAIRSSSNSRWTLYLVFLT